MYFLGIEFTYAKDKMTLLQRKYALELLQETGLLRCKVDQSPVFQDDSSKSFDNAGRYRQLIGKLIYLTITRSDISYAMGLLSLFMHKPRLIHWLETLRVLAYIKSTPSQGFVYRKHGHTQVEAYSKSGYVGDKGDKKSTSGYCTYVGGNLVIWRSKKQNVVSRSNTEAEYRSMTQTACEMM